MADAAVFEKLQEMIAEQLGVEPSEVSRDSDLYDDLKADSLDIVELVMSVEEEFDIEVSDEEVENIRTVGDAVDYIEEHSV